MVSDAGTPGVNDPGYRLITAAIEAAVPIVPIPGASAVLAALVGSGLPMERFRYEGFFPRKDAARRSALEGLRECDVTSIYFESPKRIVKSLEVVAELLPERAIVVGRELTKRFEEFLRGTAAEVLAELTERRSVKGEITLLVGPAQGTVADTGDIRRYVETLRAAGLKPSAIRQVVSDLLGVRKSAVFQEQD